jgi:hypothetical protein
LENKFEGFPIQPRNGRVLLVLIIARIYPVHQDERSLENQIALCEKYVRDRYPGDIEFRHIQGQGSGEFLERKELLQAEEAVASEVYDLIIVEDLARICRRNRALDFCVFGGFRVLSEVITDRLGFVELLGHNSISIWDRLKVPAFPLQHVYFDRASYPYRRRLRGKTAPTRDNSLARFTTYCARLSAGVNESTSEVRATLYLSRPCAIAVLSRLKWT